MAVDLKKNSLALMKTVKSVLSNTVHGEDDGQGRVVLGEGRDRDGQCRHC